MQETINLKTNSLDWSCRLFKVEGEELIEATRALKDGKEIDLKFTMFCFGVVQALASIMSELPVEILHFFHMTLKFVSDVKEASNYFNIWCARD